MVKGPILSDEPPLAMMLQLIPAVAKSGARMRAMVMNDRLLKLRMLDSASA